MGGMEWIPMAHFEVQWGSYIPGLIGLLLLEMLVTACVPKHDIKNNSHIIIFVTAYIYLQQKTAVMAKKSDQCHFASKKSHIGGMEWLPLARFEVQWGTDIPSFKGAKKSRSLGLLILESLVTAGVPKYDIKNN